MTDTALISGGAGFIGSHLAERLLSAGWRVLLIDNLSTGRRENVAELLGERCQLIEADLGEALDEPGLLRRHGVRQIYHLAASVGVRLVVNNPTAMIQDNVLETLRVLDAAAREHVPVLIASSSEVYGKCRELPLQEQMDLTYGPTTASRWSYGMAKALDEHLALDHHRRLGLPCVIARLFNTIGPRQVGQYGMVVPRFVQSAVEDQPMYIHGDGRQTRAFCDVRDTVRALADLLSTPDCWGGVYNVGSREPISIAELAQRIRRLAGSDCPVVHQPYEQVYGPDFEDPAERLPDTTRLEEAIGFERAYRLDQTLEELIASHQRRLDEACPAQTKSGP